MEKVMKINKKLKKSAQILIQIGVVFAGGMAFADPTLPANDAYDLFVGPNQTGGPLPPRTPNIGYFYTNLSRRLDNSPIKVNRLILGAVSPISDANFSPFTSDNGTFLNFLTLQLPSPSHQIFLMPDAETDTPTLWTQWSTDTSVQPTVPEKIAVWRAESKTGGGPCNFNSASPDIAYPINDPKTNITAPVAEEMMMTVCWATIMNYSAGGASPLISGLVYDGESNIVQTTPENLSWFKQELNYYHQSIQY
jgi:hypothetical protein